MKSYFDTSVLVPLLIDEQGSDEARRVFDESETVMTSRLAYPESRAALAQANRLSRVADDDLRAAVVRLQILMGRLIVIEIDEALAAVAGDVAESFALRGYDAVHLAAAILVEDPLLVFVAGDRQLLRAATEAGLPTVDPTPWRAQ